MSLSPSVDLSISFGFYAFAPSFGLILPFYSSHSFRYPFLSFSPTIPSIFSPVFHFPFCVLFLLGLLFTLVFFSLSPEFPNYCPRILRVLFPIFHFPFVAAAAAAAVVVVLASVFPTLILFAMASTPSPALPRSCLLCVRGKCGHARGVFPANHHHHRRLDVVSPWPRRRAWSATLLVPLCGGCN